VVVHGDAVTEIIRRMIQTQFLFETITHDWAEADKQLKIVQMQMQKNDGKWT
jgi:hypothetical protein